jgi:hypothetical protein
MYSGNKADMEMANELLNSFKGHPDAWLRVDQILVNAQKPHTKFFGLQILGDAVNVSPNTLYQITSELTFPLHF